MKMRFLSMVLLLTFIINMIAVTAVGNEQPKNVSRQKVTAAALQEIPGYNLTAVTVQLEPGTTVDPHRHGGFVFVYVLEGTIRSRLDDDVEINYQVGDSWVEPPGTLHRLTRNPSKTTTAKFLAVFVAEADSILTSSANRSE